MRLTPENISKPEAGKILLSEPFLNDPYFKRAAILLCEHNDEGSFGFVLNNYINMSVDEIMKDLPQINSKVSIGGPVQNSNLYYLHTMGNSIIDSREIVEGIYLGGDFEFLKSKIIAGEVNEDEIRFFVGYSGWTANQLAEEMEENSWFVTEATPDLVMNVTSEDLWGEFLREMGPEFAKMIDLPSDPNMN